ncbi:hypothetical protein TVAG_350150 [Trichomonas vaginalis G3]|uniref:Uncharacterized protein n=1 Tax=Trichomonas vaginalis (strain ATCC PRA-98 / G3) TaxID=412133 RepID=A2F3J6_TRIV3|nr:hypothetical protein TVAGG3_0194210 [Trichomonas vaginalis G3]EAY00519.1 hypothetical protein TVAG_350150 [Trichomonas vaginalis G3]KAI5550190.1 hypothetical protein TVAGG3_0194210 [Trichomonas vaginalis G3]|eukprot:XP_001313448.1 hypothetical protein [Trichomonas vaginalis G3]
MSSMRSTPKVRGENLPLLENAIMMASNMNYNNNLGVFPRPEEMNKIIISIQEEEDIDKKIITTESEIRDSLLWFNEKNKELMKLVDQYNILKTKVLQLFDNSKE